MKERHIDTTRGWVAYQRQRYYCRKCKKGYYPFDDQLHLSKHSGMSHKKERLLGLLSVHMPYRDVEVVYQQLSGCVAGRMSVHRIVQRLGKEEAEAINETQSIAKQDKLHAGGDGVLLRIRGEGWKEGKVATCYGLKADGEAGQTYYSGTLGDRKKLGEKLYRLAGRPNLEETKSMAFVSDAAEWLSEIQQLHFPSATAIVDFWHASQYVWKVADRFYGQGSARTQRWVEEKIQLLKEGNQKSLQSGFGKMKGKTAEQKKALKDSRRYFRNHGHKMLYPRYREQGFHIGSGVTEAACKLVIQTRFKRAGMQWSRPGAENLLQLRLCYLNGHWQKLAEQSLN